MVSSEQIYEAGVSKFVGEKECYNLNVILISIHIITLKQVLFVRGWSNLVEKTDKVL